MGIMHVAAIVRRTDRRSKAVEVRLLVDTGAVYSVLPHDVWQALKLQPMDRADFTLADGSRPKPGQVKDGDAFINPPVAHSQEHLEDVRDKPATRHELRRLLQQASARRPVLLTLTRSRGDRQVSRWLRAWTDVTSLD